MSHEAALLAAIRQQPEDDNLRLIFADWLEETSDPERADFIRTQVEASRHPSGSAEHSRLTDRAIELLARNGHRWANGFAKAAPADTVLSVHKAEYPVEQGIFLLRGRKDEHSGGLAELFSYLCFHRGFVDEVRLTPARLFALSEHDIHSAGPLPTLHLELFRHEDSPLGTFADIVRHLASAPLVRHFRDICLAGGFGSTTEEGLGLLAKEPALLAKLAGLRLSEDPVGDPAVLRILASPLLTRLRELTIDGTECTSAVVDPLVRSQRFRGMRYLHLEGVLEGARGLGVFAVPGRWPRLRCLFLGSCGLNDLTLKGLMRPGAFPALEVLDLCCSDVHPPALRSLLLSGAFPRLRTLGIGGAPLPLDEVQALRAEFGHRVEIHFPVRRRHCPANADRSPRTENWAMSSEKVGVEKDSSSSSTNRRVGGYLAR